MKTKRTASSMHGAARILALVFCVCIAFTALSACNSGQGGDKAALRSAEDIYKHILTLSDFPKMEKGNDEDAEDFYGIDLKKIKSYELGFSSVGTLADEIAVFELEDEGYSSVLLDLLKQRLVRAASAARDYSPEQYEIIMKSTVEKKGSFVFYVVNEKSESIASELKKFIAE